MSDAYSSVYSCALLSDLSQWSIVEKPTSEEFSRIRLRRFWRLIGVVQAILLAANWSLYATWIAFHPELGSSAHATLKILLPVAAVSFVAATLIAWRHFNWVVRVF